MAEFTVTIPDNKIDSVKEAFKIEGTIPTNMQLRDILIEECFEHIKAKVLRYEDIQRRKLAKEQEEEF